MPLFVRLFVLPGLFHSTGSWRCLAARQLADLPQQIAPQHLDS